MRDVIVQVDHDHENRLVAFGGAAGVVGEVMRLDLSGGGDALALDVEVLDSRPVVLGGSVRHRVDCGAEVQPCKTGGASEDCGGGASAPQITRARLEAVLAAEDAMSMLARETRTRLLNVSGSGCLLECAAFLEPGTTGTLKVVVGGDAYDDAVRVTRALQVRGAGVWQVGVEFLWTNHPGSWSLRRMVSRLRREIAQQDVAVAFSTVGPS